MGIQGLIPFLKKATRHSNIRQWKGCTVAVDAYCWLHKGAFSCAMKLAKGEATDGYVVYCMKMVNTLLAAGVIPILVFDGQNLPSKSVTEHKRHENRKKYKQMGRLHLIEGKVSEANDCFQKCVEVTSQMARDLIHACRKLGVDCIVAPYEADAQLAYLNKAGIADIVITEDSDLVLFGCERVMFKMDMNGNGLMYDCSRLPDCLGLKAENFTFDKFRHMCILSGCDYLPNLPGIGLAKAGKFFSKTTNPDLKMILPKVPSYLNMPNLTVSKEYIEKFIQANNTFLHQLVFDPLQRRVVPLNPYPPELDPTTLDYAGPHLSDNTGYHIALGNIDVGNKKKVDNYEPDKAPQIACKTSGWDAKPISRSRSIWSRDFKASKSIISLDDDDCPPPVRHSAEKLLATVTTPIHLTNRLSSGKRIYSSVDSGVDLPNDNDLLSLYTQVDSDQKRLKGEADVEEARPDKGPLTSTENKPTLDISPKQNCDVEMMSPPPAAYSRFFLPKTPSSTTKVGVCRTPTTPSPLAKTSAFVPPSFVGRHSTTPSANTTRARISTSPEDRSADRLTGGSSARSPPSSSAPSGRLFFDKAFAARLSTKPGPTKRSPPSNEHFASPPKRSGQQSTGLAKLQQHLRMFEFGNERSDAAPFVRIAPKSPDFLESLTEIERRTESVGTASLYRSTEDVDSSWTESPPCSVDFDLPLSTPETETDSQCDSGQSENDIARLVRCLDEDEGLSEEENSEVITSSKSTSFKYAAGSLFGRPPKTTSTKSRCRGVGLSKKEASHLKNKVAAKGQLSIKDSLAKFSFVKERKPLRMS